ncbi:MAG: hypothetical protein D6B25_18980 [Desulfobulbaceae bacterium]|nr:MAG: hypothetical protein D6B25_18980 [Desulfobulbaceae bacterium]
MMKKIITLVTLLSLVFPVSLIAASNRCVVKESEGKVLVIECQKEVERFPKGTKIKIKTDRVKSVEGC